MKQLSIVCLCFIVVGLIPFVSAIASTGIVGTPFCAIDDLGHRPEICTWIEAFGTTMYLGIGFGIVSFVFGSVLAIAALIVLIFRRLMAKPRKMQGGSGEAKP